MKTLCVSLLFLQCYYLLNAEDIYEESFTVVDLSKELTPRSESVTDTKSILRYGFQKTEECKNFEKAFLCIRKCLDLNYDVAYSDKKCKCTCYTRKDKAKYTTAGRKDQTKYMSGAPTTWKPIWAQDTVTENVIVDEYNDTAIDMHHEVDEKNIKYAEGSTSGDLGPTGEVKEGEEGSPIDTKQAQVGSKEGNYQDKRGEEGAQEKNKAGDEAEKGEYEKGKEGSKAGKEGTHNEINEKGVHEESKTDNDEVNKAEKEVHEDGKEEKGGAYQDSTKGDKGEDKGTTEDEEGIHEKDKASNEEDKEGQIRGKEGNKEINEADKMSGVEDQEGGRPDENIGEGKLQNN